MARFERESHLMSPVTIKKPTVLDLARLLETQRKNPEILLTCIGKTFKTTLYDVIDRGRIDQLLQQLEQLDPFTQLRGEIIVHESPKK